MEIFIVTCPEYEGVIIELVTTSFLNAVEKFKSNPSFILEVWENGETQEKRIYYKIDDMIEDGRILEV